MARPRIKLEHQRDFTGGLNVQDNAYNLGENESYDLLNVDIERRGGFGLRRGRQRHITTALGFTNGEVDAVYLFRDSTGSDHLIAARTSELKHWNGSSWAQIRVAGAANRPRFAEMGNKLYIFGDSSAHVWDGVAGSTTALTAPGFNDNLGSPSGGNAPAYLVCAVHHNVMWAANGGSTLPNRIRWSHPGQPEDWRTNDFIDIDPEDENGVITALVPYGNRLLVFKDRAVYAIHGYPPAGFSVQNLTKEAGAPSQEAVAATEDGVFFYDTQRGVFAWDGSDFHWVFRPLAPFVLENQIDNSNAPDEIVAVWHNERLWVTVPWQVPPFAGDAVTLVYYPMARNQGAWSLHTNGPMCWHAQKPIGNDQILLAADADFVFRYDVPDLFTDETTGGSASLIDGHYSTRWFDDGNPAVRKRWKRPVFVIEAEANQEIIVDVLKDYDPTGVRKTFKLGTTLAGDELVWDSGNWDEKYWAREVSLAERSAIVRGSPLGNGYSVALRFSSMDTGIGWQIHGITMKWIPKRLRN